LRSPTSSLLLHNEKIRRVIHRLQLRQARDEGLHGDHPAARRSVQFVIADITNPKSAPLGLQATVPDIKVPFRPIIEKGEEPFAMLADLLQCDWVFHPIRYSSPDALIGVLDKKIIAPAKAKFAELLARKAEGIKVEDA
jgi:hypothetical protein